MYEQVVSLILTLNRHRDTHTFQVSVLWRLWYFRMKYHITAGDLKSVFNFEQVLSVLQHWRAALQFFSDLQWRCVCEQYGLSPLGWFWKIIALTCIHRLIVFQRKINSCTFEDEALRHFEGQSGGCSLCDVSDRWRNVWIEGWVVKTNGKVLWSRRRFQTWTPENVRTLSGTLSGLFLSRVTDAAGDSPGRKRSHQQEWLSVQEADVLIPLWK